MDELPNAYSLRFFDNFLQTTNSVLSLPVTLILVLDQCHQTADPSLKF